MKYIDADFLRKEINRLYDGEAPKHDMQCNFDDGYFTGIDTISQLIDSFQQEQQEMDLDSKLSEFMSFYAYENSGEYPSTIDIARHFYELGLNTRK